MREFVRKNLSGIEWTLGALAVLLPTIAWLSRRDVSDLTLYDIFPPLGIIAFGLMWIHFVIGALRRYAGIGQRERTLFMPLSMGLVLALIILHPGLLWIALYMDGFGLPPASHTEAYGPQAGFLALGTIALLIFLAYELKRFFGAKRWWKYIERAQIVGMLAIFVHALGVGGELRLDWFFVVWVIYGLTLMASFVYSFMFDKAKKEA